MPHFSADLLEGDPDGTALLRDILGPVGSAPGASPTDILPPAVPGPRAPRAEARRAERGAPVRGVATRSRRSARLP
ncbi:hypothetical protein [Methylobacterium sp. JK268]